MPSNKHIETATSAPGEYAEHLRMETAESLRIRPQENGGLPSAHPFKSLISKAKQELAPQVVDDSIAAELDALVGECRVQHTPSKEETNHLKASLARTVNEDLVGYPDEVDEDPYLLKTSKLIARRLAEYLSDERMLQNSLRYNAMREESRVVAERLKDALRQNKELQNEVETLKAELATFEKSSFGLYKKIDRT